MKLLAYTLTLFGCWTSLASAGIVGSFVAVPEEGGFTPPLSFVTSDLIADASTDWTGGNFLLTLSSGSIYQDPLVGAGIGPPSPALVNAIASTRWDTYVTGSGGIAGGAPGSAGGAVDLGGTAAGQFNSDGLDVNWFTVSLTDFGVFSLGRFTLTNDAQGTFVLRLDSAGQTSPFILRGEVRNGSLAVVPEVGSLAFMAVAGSLIAIGLRRRSRIGIVGSTD